MIAIFPEIAGRAAAGDSESLAILVRRYFGGAETESPKPDIRQLLSNVGIRIETMPMEGCGALLAKDDRGSFEIVAIVQAGCEKISERFMLAHMLGHFLFDIQPRIARSDWTVSGFQEAGCPLRRYSNGFMATELSAADLRVEERADDFAAALLLPRGMVKRAIERLTDHDSVAAFFGVTTACLVRRLAQLQQSDAPANFLAAEDRTASAGRPALQTRGGGVRGDIDAQAMLRAPASGLTSHVTPGTKSYGAIDNAPRAQATTAIPHHSPAPPHVGMPEAPRITLRARGAGAKASPTVASAAPGKEVLAQGQGKASGKVSDKSPSGMDRIREIARLLDRNRSKDGN